MESRSKTHEEFVEEVESMYGNIYEFRTRYYSGHSSIIIKHIKCGTILNIRAEKLVNRKNRKGIYCPTCQNRQWKNTPEFDKKVRDKLGEGYEVLNEYIGKGVEVSITHSISTCGYEYMSTYSRFMSGKSRCPTCEEARLLKLEEERLMALKYRLDDFVKGKYLIIGEFIDGTTKMEFSHTCCGNIFEATPLMISKKEIKCNNLRCRKSTNKYNFNDKVYEKYNGEYVVVDEYKGSETEIRFRHNIEGCEETFAGMPKHFLYGKVVCPCQHKISRGEAKIEEFLVSREIIYKKEHSFEDCVDVGRLRFDFALLGESKNLKGLIEFDGKQHYEPSLFVGRGREEAVIALKDQQRRDKIKNKYCKENDIPLLRIPYWDIENTPTLVEDFIRKI